ncbi:nucleoside-triphosphatase [Acidobacteria bacterium AH-259-D05]|nr:nucleoside-triphosphatase [Acidobacteria bacterium AH-259-D05]
MLKKIVQQFSQLALTGFYTEEIREQGIRSGFRAVAMNGSSAVFAHRKFQTPQQHRVGKYGVKPQLLERLVVPHLNPYRKAADLVVVDEIAKMELLSVPFREGLVRALDSDCPLLGTISLKGTGFIQQLKKRSDVEIFKITLQNRDVLAEQVQRRLSTLLKRNRVTPDRLTR